MDAKSLKAMQADPAEFRRRLLIDTDRGPQRAANVLDDWQRQDFEALDDGWRRVCGHDVAPRYTRSWLERPRGHSKTADTALMVVYALFASRRTVAGIVAAADQDQASLLRDAVSRLVRLNPWLKQFIDVQAERVVNPHTESTLTIITSDAASSYGLTPDFIICDELTHWRNRDLWDSLFSSAAKRESCLLIVITNAGFTADERGKETWQFQTREAVRFSGEWYFHHLDGPKASWLRAVHLEEQRRLLPDQAYRRLWGNEWIENGGDALAPDDIDAAIKHEGPVGPEKGWAYAAGLDIGLTRDASALVVVGLHVGHYERMSVGELRRRCSPTIEAMVDAGLMEASEDSNRYETYYFDGTDQLKVVAVHIWKPQRGQKVDLDQIERTCLDVHQRYKLAALAADPWQAELLVQRLQRAEVPAEGTTFTHGNLQAMATATIEAFREQMIDLYRHPQLISDLRSLRIVEKSYGIRLDSPRGPDGHGDAATALALAILAARRNASIMVDNRVHGDLVTYP